MMAKSQSKATLRASLRRISPALIVFLVGFGLIFGSAGHLQAAAVQAANAGREGQTIDLNTLPAKGKTTVVDVFSPYCPPCMQLAPLLEQLAQKRPDLVIKKVNIQRPEISGKIDWQSPLAKQLGLHSIPHFMIFEKGKLTAQGQEATKQVVDWLRQAGLLKN